MKDIHSFEKIIDITFKKKEVLKQALVHRSYLNEHTSFALGHNERLEFLGDAVLELIVTEYLYNNFDNPEGELTNWRASLVNAKILGGIAKNLGFDEFLLLSKGESKDGSTKARWYILANAMEAVIGAIYVDQGWDAAKNFVHRFIIVHLPTILENRAYIDSKSSFQEAAQEKTGITPSYKVLKEWGPDHDKHFIVGVFLDKEQIAEGKGTSKQEAQTEAAENALTAKKW